MIRSTTSSVKFSNTGKLQTVNLFIDEYRRVVSEFVELLWDEEKVPTLLPKEITSRIETWLSARMLQCAGKQASGIVRGTRTKQQRRLFTINKLKKQKLYKKARRLQKIYDECSISRPNVNNVCPELDSRFVTIDLDNNTCFDGWVRLRSIGNKIKLDIPFKKSKHFNKLLQRGKLKSGIRISRKQLTFMFDIPDTEKKTSGNVIGIDIGQITTISCSNGYLSGKDNHGWDLVSITNKLCRKKRGSQSFRKTKQHRKNYVNWTINQLDFDDVKEVKLENIRNMRKGKRTNRRLSHWTYTDIFSKLGSRCEELGVQVTRISPTYTSKRCSVCGWTRRSNRKGKEFKCTKCGYILDADLNASRNIASNLVSIDYKKRQLHDIGTGFYWTEVGEESVVPPVPKTNFQYN